MANSINICLRHIIPNTTQLFYLIQKLIEYTKPNLSFKYIYIIWLLRCSWYLSEACTEFFSLVVDFEVNGGHR